MCLQDQYPEADLYQYDYSIKVTFAKCQNM